ncbi:MAG: hypothetical protein ACPLPW_08645, partial [bacterium]
EILQALLPICDELWGFIDYGISQGMLEEIRAFTEAKKPVILLSIKDIWDVKEIHERYFDAR